MSIIYLDFETRSTIDIKKAGLDVYARHPSTEILCVGFAFDDEPVRIWKPEGSDVAICSHADVIQLMDGIQSGIPVVAHNAAFELAIWNYVCVPKYRWPILPPQQVVCTMARCYAMALPGSLEKAAAALGIKQQKDMAGHRVMMQLSQPRSIDNQGNPTWWENPEKYERLYEYCRQDIEVERQINKLLFALDEKEKTVWFMDYLINQRGIRVDLKATQKGISIIELEKERLDSEMKFITEGKVDSCQATSQITKWLKEKNIPIDGIGKQVLVEALKKEISEDCRKVITLRQEAAKSSTAKLKSFIEGTCPDGRMRGLFQYHGSSTGRFAGRRIQPHNFPRPKLSDEEIDEVFEILTEMTDPKNARDLMELYYGSPLQIISDCLRGFLIPGDGHVFIGGDFANIEGRALAWLACETWKIDAFDKYDQGLGEDLYKIMGGYIYHKDPKEVTKEERQIGKVAELACGYGGGKNAFQMMGETYGIKVPPDQAESIKNRWREGNKGIVRFWYSLEETAKRAVLDPTRIHFVNPNTPWQIGFKKAGSFLWCELPSERIICYPYPKLQPMETPWGEMKEMLTYLGESPLSKKWERQKMWGGLIAENVTQAICRDILVTSMLRLENTGYPIVLHVHDEIVSEVPHDYGSVEEFKKIMEETPYWCPTLPISVEGWKGKRYRK